MLKRYIIERNIPGIGQHTVAEVRDAARKSNEALDQLAPNVQWVESYLAGDKTFCVYLAKDEETILEHARISGFPADCITEIHRVIDPTTERGGRRE